MHKERHTHTLIICLQRVCVCVCVCVCVSVRARVSDSDCGSSKASQPRKTGKASCCSLMWRVPMLPVSGKCSLSRGAGTKAVTKRCVLVSVCVSVCVCVCVCVCECVYSISVFSRLLVAVSRSQIVLRVRRREHIWRRMYNIWSSGACLAELQTFTKKDWGTGPM